MTDPFEHLDGAYVLGALAPGEQALFEEHLAGCAECTARVAELAPLTMQLAQLSADDVLGAVPPLPDTVLPALLREARRRRRRTRGLVAALGAVAAAAVIALVVAVRPSSPSAPPAVAMRAAPGAPVTATVRLEARTWGTEIDVHCRYAEAAGGGHDAVPYVLVVSRADGSRQSLNRWRLGPGQDADFVGASDWSRAEITQIAIQLLPSRLTVLSLDV